MKDQQTKKVNYPKIIFVLGIIRVVLSIANIVIDIKQRRLSKRSKH